MAILNTYSEVGLPTNVHIPVEILNNLPNGLFRATYEETQILVPEFGEVTRTIPIDNKDDYVYDVKLHMLMPNQYPCIPNWHCDNVPRDATNALDYTKANTIPDMYLWVSGTPCTEFLAKDWVIDQLPTSHIDLAATISEKLNRASGDVQMTKFIKPQQWIKMNALTPHRGTISSEYTWRIFVRATHKSVVPIRTTISPIRRHSQVYLDSANFGW